MVLNGLQGRVSQARTMLVAPLILASNLFLSIPTRVLLVASTWLLACLCPGDEYFRLYSQFDTPALVVILVKFPPIVGYDDLGDVVLTHHNPPQELGHTCGRYGGLAFCLNPLGERI